MAGGSTRLNSFARVPTEAAQTLLENPLIDIIFARSACEVCVGGRNPNKITLTESYTVRHTNLACNIPFST